MVGEHHSSADRRDVYYGVEVGALRDQLEGLAAELNPALRWGEESSGDVHGAVLFLCTGNSARSQMAEALLRNATNGRVIGASAGTRPEGVHPLAIKTLEDMGVLAGDLRSKHWSEVERRRFDRVVSLCDIARDEVPARMLGRHHIHWSVPDPSAVTGSARRREAAFRAVADQIRQRIPELLASMAAAAA